MKAPGLTSIGVRGKDSVVLVTQRKVADKLIDPSSVTNMFRITDTMGCVTTGLIADAKNQVLRARHEAAQFEYENGFPIPVEYMAHRTANVAQVYTQHAFMRALGVVTIFGGMDEEKGPQLFRVDPAGHYVGMKAAAAGPKEQEANNYLEKKIKAKPEMNFQETVELAIVTLQTVLGADLKPAELEVAICSADQPEFKVSCAQTLCCHCFYLYMSCYTLHVRESHLLSDLRRAHQNIHAYLSCRS